MIFHFEVHFETFGVIFCTPPVSQSISASIASNGNNATLPYKEL